MEVMIIKLLLLTLYRTISVEVNHSNVTAINEVMLQNGYKIHKEIHNIDIIYVKT